MDDCFTDTKFRAQDFTEEASEPIMQPMLSSVLKKVRNSSKIRCFSG